MKIEACETCRFFTPYSGAGKNGGLCTRYPPLRGFVKVAGPDWCGEWRAEQNRLCLKQGRELAKGMEPRTIGDVVFRGFAPTFARCLRVHKHEGSHSDGFEDWTDPIEPPPLPPP
jgi:hypothetical protein